ncbi:MAG: OmpA family protein [Proteobacteria bacterium]|nr:OmpA family protein [Pseudomonadota bacterium]
MRIRPKEKINEPEDDWLITYADAITLLLAFFVILISFSKVDVQTFEKVAAEIKKEIRKEEKLDRPIFSLFNNLSSVIDGSPSLIKENADVTFDERGVVLEFTGKAFFKSGSAVLLPEAKQVLATIAGEMKVATYEDYFINVEGHTDNIPIKTARFPSNWELSASRASSVVRYFIALSLNPSRLRASGYADTKPKLPNSDLTGNVLKENQAANRRVVLRLHP